MEPEASLPWLALTMTPDRAARLSARLLREYGTPDGVFDASLTGHESSNLTARIIAGMPLCVVIVEGKQYSGSLITARLTMEFGREAFGVPRNVTEELSFAPNQLNKQGAKLVTNAEDVIEELPTPVRAALEPAQAAGAEQRNLLAEDGLTPTGAKINELLAWKNQSPSIGW